MGGEIEAERLGQGLMLGDGQHRSQGAGVVVVRVEQRQTSEEVRARRNISVASWCLTESRAKARDLAGALLRAGV